MDEPATAPLVLGVDGGGSKTAVLIGRVDDSGQLRVIGRARGGGSNPRAVGLNNAEANLFATIDEARRAAGLAADAVCDVACLAVAGTGREGERQWLERLVQRRGVARRCRIVHDALPVLAAAAADPMWGVALVAGTGSLAFGCDRSGHTARAGGWGYVFGDEGSGYWIAVEGLRAAARSDDGRGPATVLAERLPQRLGVDAPEGLVAAIYGANTGRRSVAALAEVVFDAEARGDAVAAEIVRRAAGELGTMVAAVARALQIDGGPFPLALAGGALLGSEHLRSELVDWLAAHRLAATPITTVADPVDGALRLALGEFADPSL